MKTAIEEMIDEARVDAGRLIDEATRLEQDALLAEQDGNGDPVYLRASAVGCRAKADELINAARSSAARALGSIRTDQKAAASRENGKKGGRPKKPTEK